MQVALELALKGRVQDHLLSTVRGSSFSCSSNCMLQLDLATRSPPGRAKLESRSVCYSHSQRLQFSIMKRGREPFWRPPRRQEVANMADVLEQVERSGRIFFVKTLSKTAIQTCETDKTAILSLPAQFVRENSKKIEQWVILRAHLSCGRSGRPWVVRISVSEAGRVLLCGGFYTFVTDNRLREGDSLIFVLQEDARSEFEVYTFHGSQGVPLDPDVEGDSDTSDEENSSDSSLPPPLRHQNERKKAFARDTRKHKATPSQFASQFDYHRVLKNVPTSDTREGRATPSHFASPLQNHRGFPAFRKRLTASNIGRSDRDPWTNSGQFELPERFLRKLGMMVQNPVKLQGIHEDSPTHVITCRRRPGTRLRVDFLVTGWSRFVKENGLEKGHELEFSLMADSYFVVRKVY